MSKLRALLYYVHATKYNQINCECPRFLTIHFYILVQFHTQNCFSASLPIRVSDSGHPVTYAGKNLQTIPAHKIYRCLSERSTRHHTILNNLTILHTKTFFTPAFHRRKEILSKTKMSQSLLIHPHSPHTSLFTSEYDSNTNSNRKIFLFPSLGLFLGLRLRLWSSQPLDHNWYKSLHTTTQITSYFYFFCSPQLLSYLQRWGSFRLSIFCESISHQRRQGSVRLSYQGFPI